MKPVFAALFGLLVTGCVTTQQAPGLTIYSNPIGATITENTGSAIPQTAPATYQYNRGEQSCLRVIGFTATWPSGASANTGNIDLCGAYADYQFVINRPQEAPNLHIDTQYAASLQLNQQMRDQQAAMLLLLGQSQQPRVQSSGSITTRCYTYGNITRCESN